MKSRVQQERMLNWDTIIVELKEQLNEAGFENIEYRESILRKLEMAYLSSAAVIDLEIQLNKAKINP